MTNELGGFVLVLAREISQVFPWTKLATNASRPIRVGKFDGRTNLTGFDVFRYLKPAGSDVVGRVSLPSLAIILMDGCVP
jgi:hypothetical protein